MLSGLFTNAAIYALEKPAPFLRWTAAGTYTLSTLAQAGGIAINKEVPPKERKFLVLQELINGVLQLATFITIATTMENYGRKLALQGKILGHKLPAASPNFVKGMAVLFSLAGTVLSFNIITPLLRNPLAAYLQNKFKKTVSPVKNDLTRPIVPALNLKSPLNTDIAGPFKAFEDSLKTNTLRGRLNIKA